MADELKFRAGYEIGFIAITQNCNAECPHCHACSGPGKPHLPLEKVKKAVKLYIDNAEPETLEIQLSGGEALTHPDIFEILRYGKSLNNEVQYSILSNGLLLEGKKGDKLARKLKEEGVDGIIISEDQFHPKVDIEKISKHGDSGYPDIRSNLKKKYETVTAIGRGKNLKKIWKKEEKKECSIFCGGSYYEYAAGGKEIAAISYHADFNGKIRYCPWNAGFLGTVDESIDEIKERVEKDLAFKMMHKDSGLEYLFKLATEIDPKHDELPPNCARCHAITRDEELMEKVQEKLKNAEIKLKGTSAMAEDCEIMKKRPEERKAGKRFL